jgi:hypothetical protein
MTVKVLSVECVDHFVTEAKNSPRLCRPSNIHLDYVELCQRLIALIVMNNDGVIEQF